MDRERVHTNTTSKILGNSISSDAHDAIEHGTNGLAEIHAAEGGFGVGGSGAAAAAEVGLYCVDGAAFY
jgi:hypothetical protein